MGEMVAARGDGECAEEAYRIALTIWESLGNTPPPDDETRTCVAMACNRLARVHYGRGEYDKAFQYYNRAIQLDVHQSRHHDELARALVSCPDPKYRDPARSVGCALDAVRYDFFVAQRWTTLGAVLSNLPIPNPKLEIQDKDANREKSEIGNPKLEIRSKSP
jgi:tetratricopeptide (TPR) repeat protein